jgi:hypothetical protein
MEKIPEKYKKYLNPNEDDINYLINYYWWHNYIDGNVNCPPPFN